MPETRFVNESIFYCLDFFAIWMIWSFTWVQQNWIYQVKNILKLHLSCEMYFTVSFVSDIFMLRSVEKYTD